jgi:hypothetical protein
MFTMLALILFLAIMGSVAVERRRADLRRTPESAPDAEARQSELRRQDLRQIAYLLGAILIMLGLIADRLH